MIKYFCDVCGKEVTRNFVDKRLNVKVGIVSVEVMLGVNLVHNHGVVCGKCLASILCEAIKIDANEKEIREFSANPLEGVDPREMTSTYKDGFLKVFPCLPLAQAGG